MTGEIISKVLLHSPLPEYLMVDPCVQYFKTHLEASLHIKQNV